MKSSGILGAILWIAFLLKILASPLVSLEESDLVNQILDLAIIAASTALLTIKWRSLGERLKLLMGSIMVLATYLMLSEMMLVEGRPIDTLLYYFRMFSPIVFFAGVLAWFKGRDLKIDRDVRNLGIYLIALSIVGVFTMPELENHDVMWWGTYFSGLHKSSYILASIAVVFFYRLHQSYGNRQINIAVILACLIFLTYGWGIRTAQAFVLVVCSAYLLSGFGARERVIGLLLVAQLLVWLAFFLYDIDWNRFSSGRLGMWSVKIRMLNDATLPQFIFGRGFGSDYVEVEGWWGERDSHNNFLQVLTEKGIVGLMIVGSIIWQIFRLSRESRMGTALVIGYVATCLLSNGLMFRVLPGYVFFCALAYVLVIDIRTRQPGVMPAGLSLSKNPYASATHVLKH